MITNERQYRIVRSQAERFRESLRQFNEIQMIQEGIDPVIVSAHRDSVASELRELERQIADFEHLRAGSVDAFCADSILGVGGKLIEARIASGLSQRELADRLGMKEQQIQRYEQDRYRSASLSRIAEVTAALALDADIVLRPQGELVSGDELFQATNLGRLPAREMVKRGWIAHQASKGELQDAASLYVMSMLKSVDGVGLNRLHVRANGKFDCMALLAWKARVVERSRAISAPDFDHQSLDALKVQSLVRLSRHPKGPVEAVERLRECGVRVVFERHLPSTHLDGAAMLDDRGNPVIGITLRYDRLDNFWFVLLHEIAHVVCHRERGLREGFFDDEQAQAGIDVEREADDFASKALIPKEAWEQSFVRYSTNKQQVIQFAEQLQINPAIVCGRIRKERGDYSVFTELLGRGQLLPMFATAGLVED